MYADFLILIKLFLIFQIIFKKIVNSIYQVYLIWYLFTQWNKLEKLKKTKKRHAIKKKKSYHISRIYFIWR